MILATIISYGRVQGVNYRAFVKSVANNLGVKGWVKNLPDGTVKIVCEVENEKKLEEFKKGIFVRKDFGPYVERMEVKTENIEKGRFSDFRIKY